MKALKNDEVVNVESEMKSSMFFFSPLSRVTIDIKINGCVDSSLVTEIEADMQTCHIEDCDLNIMMILRFESVFVV